MVVPRSNVSLDVASRPCGDNFQCITRYAPVPYSTATKPPSYQYKPSITAIVSCGEGLTSCASLARLGAPQPRRVLERAVTLKEGHQLISTGPYGFARHPIYTGMLLGTVGTALVVGEWRGVLAVVMLLAAHSRKAMREELMLTTEFGEEYTAYRQKTGFLFPRLWGRSVLDTKVDSATRL